MEKGYREVICPGSTVQRCGQKLRLNKITEKHYNTTQEVTCPKCSTKFKVHIPTPNPGAEQKAEVHSSNNWDAQVEEAQGTFNSLFERLGAKFNKW